MFSSNVMAQRNFINTTKSTPVEAGVIVLYHGGGLGEGGDGSSLLFPRFGDNYMFCTNIVVVLIRVTRKHPVLDMNLRGLLLFL